MANIAVQRIKRELKEVLNSDEVCAAFFSLAPKNLNLDYIHSHLWSSPFFFPGRYSKTLLSKMAHSFHLDLILERCLKSEAYSY